MPSKSSLFQENNYNPIKCIINCPAELSVERGASLHNLILKIYAVHLSLPKSVVTWCPATAGEPNQWAHSQLGTLPSRFQGDGGSIWGYYENSAEIHSYTNQFYDQKHLNNNFNKKSLSHRSSGEYFVKSSPLFLW